MTGTDYNAIVADLNRPTATVRPKAQPNASHAIGSTRQPLVMLTGDGRGAERYPTKRNQDSVTLSDSESYIKSRQSRKHIIPHNRIPEETKKAFLVSDGWTNIAGGLWEKEENKMFLLSEAYALAKRRKYDREYKEKR